MHTPATLRSALLRALLTTAALTLGLGSLSACERRVGEGANSPAVQPGPGSPPGKPSR
jgi:hypothetical protein